MKRTKKGTKVKILVLAINMVILLITSIVSLYAWFELRNAYDATIETGTMNAEVTVMFGENNGSLFYDQVKKAYVINAFDSAADNYIEKLTVTVKVTSDNASRVRIKFQDEWQLTRTLNDETIANRVSTHVLYHETMGPVYLPHSPFKWGSDFSPKFDGEGYIYYPDIIKNTSQTIALVAGGDRYPVRTNQTFTEECYVYVNIRVDILQANRIEQVWGILPSFFEEGGQS